MNSPLFHRFCLLVPLLLVAFQFTIALGAQADKPRPGISPVPGTSVPVLSLDRPWLDQLGKDEAASMLRAYRDLAASRYPAEFILDDQVKVPDFKLRLTLMPNKPSGYVASLTLNTPDGQEVPGGRSGAVLGPDPVQAIAALGEITAGLVAVARNPGGLPGTRRPPRMLAGFSTAAIKSLAGTETFGMAIAVSPVTGNILVQEYNGTFSLDRFGRLVTWQGRQANEKGTTFGMMNLAVSPAGTVWVSDAYGRNLLRYPESSDQYTELPCTASMGSQFSLTSDGRILLRQTDGQFLLQQEGHVGKLGLAGVSNPSYIGTWGLAPDDALVYWDIEARVFRYHSLSGAFIRIVRPRFNVEGYESSLAPNGQVLIPRRDGSLVYTTSGGLVCMNKEGTLGWFLEPGEAGGTNLLAARQSVAIDETRGWLWMSRTGQGLSRWHLEDLPGAGTLDDKDLALADLYSSRPPSGADDKAEAAWNARLGKLMEKLGSPDQELEAWARVRILDPESPEAHDRLAALKADQVRRRISINRDSTMRLLKTLGQESARGSYQQTMRLYEEELARNPEDRMLRKDMRRLAEDFQLASVLSAPSAGLELTAKDIPSIFPSMGEIYRQKGLGSFRVVNTGDQAMTDLTVSFRIPGYMDSPSVDQTRRTLKPGEEANFAIPLVLNSASLRLTESLGLQAELSVSWRQGGRDGSQSWFLPVRLHQRNALSWDETARLASFITPNESVISTWTHRLVSAATNAPGISPALPEKIRQALVVVQALGSMGMTWVEDPLSPITTSMGRPEVVDTVRFARQTLMLQGGDCDDTTVLLASALESLGISTAIMTSPGHVFLAFDTGEPASQAWLYSTLEAEALIRNSSVWIPLETTVTTQGYAEAWRQASLVIRRSKPSDIEFIPVASVRDRFPALALEDYPSMVPEPQGAAFNTALASGYRNLETLAYPPVAKKLENDAARSQDSLRASNQLGILHATWNHLDEARSLFETLQKKSNRPSTVINYANVLVLAGETAKALDILAQGFRTFPDSSRMAWLLARLAAQNGEATGNRGAAAYLALKKLEPTMARDLEIWYEGGRDGNRAARQANPPPRWEP